MARRNKRNNAETDQETASTAPELRPEGSVDGLEANVTDVEGTPEQVTVNENKDGEATNQTTEGGDESSVQNTDKIPQNDVDKIETTPAPNDIAEKADADRTEEELQFANESNPNQKGRNAAAPEKYDQDGNVRTDGYSYGAAPDDTRGMSKDSIKINAGTPPEKTNPKTKFDGIRVFTAEPKEEDTINTESPNADLSPKKVIKLEEELSRPKEGIAARVLSATGSYYRIKFYKNNKPFVVYKARTTKLDKSEVKAFLDAALKVEQ